MPTSYYPQIVITPNLKLSLVGMSDILAENLVIIDAAVGLLPGTPSGLAFKVEGGTSPSPLGTETVLPSGQFSSLWVQDANGVYQIAAAVDTTTTWAGIPTKGVISFSRPVMFNKSGISPVFPAIGAIQVFNRPVAPSDTVAMQVYTNMALGDTASYNNQILGIYAETTIAGTGPFGGSTAGEITASGLRGVISDVRNAANTQKLYGVSSAYFRNSITAQFGNNPGNGAFYGWASNLAGGAAGSGQARFNVYYGAGAMQIVCTNASFCVYHAEVPSPKFPNGNTGFECVDYGTGGSDWNIFSASNAKDSGANFLGGPIVLGAHGILRTARVGGSAPGNRDIAGKLVFTAATVVSYVFTETYNVAPIVVISPVAPGGVVFEITAITTTGFTVTAGSTFTGVVNYVTVGQN